MILLNKEDPTRLYDADQAWYERHEWHWRRADPDTTEALHTRDRVQRWAERRVPTNLFKYYTPHFSLDSCDSSPSGDFRLDYADVDPVVPPYEEFLPNSIGKDPASLIASH